MPLPDAATYDPTDPAVQKSWLSEGQTLKERWFADYELRTVFMHDHHFADVMQNRGMFNALIVEPAGFDSRDPATGEYLQPINNVGTRHGVHGHMCRATRPVRSWTWWVPPLTTTSASSESPCTTSPR